MAAVTLKKSTQLLYWGVPALFQTASGATCGVWPNFRVFHQSDIYCPKKALRDAIVVVIFLTFAELFWKLSLCVLPAQIRTSSKPGVWHQARFQIILRQLLWSLTNQMNFSGMKPLGNTSGTTIHFTYKECCSLLHLFWTPLHCLRHLNHILPRTLN